MPCGMPGPFSSCLTGSPGPAWTGTRPCPCLTSHGTAPGAPGACPPAPSGTRPSRLDGPGSLMPRSAGAGGTLAASRYRDLCRSPLASCGDGDDGEYRGPGAQDGRAEHPTGKRDRPVEPAQLIIMPQQTDLRTATSSCGLRRNRIATPTWADEVFGTGNANPIPVTITSKAQIEAKIVTPKSFALIGWDQAIYRLDEQSHVKAPSRVCDLRRLKTCKISDRRRQFILRRHGSALNKNRNNRDIASQGRLNFKPHPILRRI